MWIEKVEPLYDYVKIFFFSVVDKGWKGFRGPGPALTVHNIIKTSAPW